MNRQRLKKTAALTAVVLLTMTSGCGKVSTEETESSGTILDEEVQKESAITQSYREKDAALPDGTARVYAIRQVEGITWLSADNGVFYQADGEEAWTKRELDIDPAAEGCSAGAIGSDGTLAFVLEDDEIAVISPDGTTQWLKADFPQDSCYTVSFLSESLLLLTSTDSSIQVLDIGTGQVRGKIPADGVSHYLAAPFNDTILTLTGEGVKLYTPEGEMTDGNEVLNSLLSADLTAFDSGGSGVLFSPDLEGSGYFYVSPRGLYHYTTGGSVTERIIDGTANRMGDRTVKLAAMTPLSDGDFLVVFLEGESGIPLLKRYTRSEGEGNGTATALTVYSLYENVMLRQELNVFSQNNPDYVVSLEIGVTEGTGITEDDAIKTLNTEILAGTGPDVLILDGLSVEKYAESGLLADLSAVLAEVEADEGIYETIAEAYAADGIIPAVPARFAVPVIQGKAEEIQSVTDLESLSALAERLKTENPEMPGVFGLYGEDLLNTLFDLCAPAWLLPDGSLDQEQLTTFLQTVKQIQEIQLGNSTQYEELGYYDNSDAEIFLPGSIGVDISAAIYRSKSLNFLSVGLEANQKQGLMIQGACGQSQNVFIPLEILGVNAKGTNTEKALEFVRQLLSADCQQQFTIEDCGYPVNRTAFSRLKENELTAEYNDLDTYGEVYREGFARMEELIEGLTTKGVTDNLVRSAVLESGMDYLSGARTLEDAVSSIVQKVSLHMAE